MLKNFKKKNMKKALAVMAEIFLTAAAVLFIYFWTGKEDRQKIPYTEFIEYAESGKVESIDIALSDKEFKFTFRDGVQRDEKFEKEGKTQNGTGRKKQNAEGNPVYVVPNPKYDNFKKDMLELGIEVKEHTGSSSYTSYIQSGMLLFFMVSFLSVFYKQTGGSGSRKKNGKKGKTVTFQDIAGLDEIKQDLMTIVNFLKYPQRYKDAGAKLPKGVMLYGPPGTGKTLLAKAIAGEAGVELIAVAGSEFDEHFVGIGAQRIRKLFSEAKEKSPCIIFIDEIDAIGGKRTKSASSTDRQSINQLLSEMDGFFTDDGIIVIAATNRLEDLDPALVRPGRFDSHFAVPLPVNEKDRRSIISIYTKNKKIGEDADMDLFAKETLGCSPADIEAVINEAAILAADRHNGIIMKQDLDDAFYKQVMKGHKKKDMERKKEEIRLAAWHEASHALAGLLLSHDVTKVTIIPSTSGAGGVTFFNNEKVGMFSKRELEEEIMTLYAGRAGEEIAAGRENITTGASSDITEATKIIKSFIMKYGMSSYGMLDLGEIDTDKNQVVDTASEISDRLYKKVYAMLEENKHTLELIVSALMEEETLTGDQIREIAGMNK